MKKLFAITCTTALCLLSVVCCALGAETANSQNSPDPTTTQTETATATDTDPRSSSTTGELQETQIDAPVVVTTEEESWEPTTTTVRQTTTTFVRHSYQQCSLTDNEVRKLCQVVFCESGSVSIDCQKAVTSVILNSMKLNNLTLDEEISTPNRYEVYPYCLEVEPTQQTIEAVMDVLKNGSTVPETVLYFREGHYHDFGTPYCNYDNVYFSSR